MYQELYLYYWPDLSSLRDNNPLTNNPNNTHNPLTSSSSTCHQQNHISSSFDSPIPHPDHAGRAALERKKGKTNRFRNIRDKIHSKANTLHTSQSSLARPNNVKKPRSKNENHMNRIYLKISPDPDTLTLKVTHNPPLFSDPSPAASGNEQLSQRKVVRLELDSTALNLESLVARAVRYETHPNDPNNPDKLVIFFIIRPIQTPNESALIS